MALRSNRKVYIVTLLLLFAGAAWFRASAQEKESPLPKPCRDIVLMPAKANDTIVTLASYSSRFECWFAYGPALGVQNNPALNIHVAVDAYPIDRPLFYQQMTEKLAADKQPDLIVTAREVASEWYQKGYLATLNSCFERQSTLQTILPELLAPSSSNGEIYAIPITTDMYVLYYNKTLLRQLGWTESEIGTLPSRIANGTFTQYDLLKTAQQAIKQGIVEPGYGIWPDNNGRNIVNLYQAFGGQYYDPAQKQYLFNAQAYQGAVTFGQLLLETGVTLPIYANQTIDWADRMLQQDVIVQNRVLFWHSYSSKARNLWHDYGIGADFLNNFGIAPFPTAISGQEPVLRFGQIVLAATPAAFRNEQQMEATCAVLAQAIAPETNAAMVSANFTWGVTEATFDSLAYTIHPLYQQLKPMLRFLPLEPELLGYALTRDQAMRDAFGQAELGNLSAEEATEQVVSIIETAFGNDVQIVR